MFVLIYQIEVRYMVCGVSFHYHSLPAVQFTNDCKTEIDMITNPEKKSSKINS